MLGQPPLPFTQKLHLVTGKGGVGKTTFSLALAQRLSEMSERVLWVGFDKVPDFLEPKFKMTVVQVEAAFEEYVLQKLRIKFLASLLTSNRFIKALVRAAPGTHEILLLGKVWNESKIYHHVVVDMPSTGHGMAMLQSVENYGILLGSGPLRSDTEAMMGSLSDPGYTGIHLLTLPEESPVVETLELKERIKKMFPMQNPNVWVNRRFSFERPKAHGFVDPGPSETWESPLADDTDDFLNKRWILENEHLTKLREPNLIRGEFACYDQNPVFNMTKRLEELWLNPS